MPVQSESRVRRVIWFLLAVSAAGLAGIYWMSDNPFGWQFQLAAAAASAGFGSLLLLLARAGLRAGSWKLPFAVLSGCIGLILLLGAVFLVTNRRAPVLPQLSSLSLEQWNEDLELLASELPRLHRNLFATLTREDFEAAVARWREEFSGMTTYQRLAGLMRLVALPQHGHTLMFPSLKANLHFLPLKVFVTGDTLYVSEAGREWRDLEGAEIVAIGGKPVPEVLRKLRSLIGVESEGQYYDRFALWGMSTELLEAC